MFQKTILIIVALSTVIVISGCRGFDKGLSEYGRASRKYNSNRGYSRKTPRSRLSPQATKDIMNSYPSGRKRGQSLYH